MRTMNYRLIAIIIISLLGAACSDESVLQNPGNVVSNAGTVSQANFVVLAADTQPTVLDTTTGVYTFTSVQITAYIGDRNDQILTDSHTINFRTEWGLIEPSCDTVAGNCTVTWTTTNFNTFPADVENTIIAYTGGEESFPDANGNSRYDDPDGTTFTDVDEPYIDANGDSAYTSGEIIIDTINGNDSTGTNGVHDIADGFYNGTGCQHTSLCSTRQSVTVWNEVDLDLDGP